MHGGPGGWLECPLCALATNVSCPELNQEEDREKGGVKRSSNEK